VRNRRTDAVDAADATVDAVAATIVVTFSESVEGIRRRRGAWNFFRAAILIVS
jgi:hypothetical protein